MNVPTPPPAPGVEAITKALASAPVAGSNTTTVSLGEITFVTPAGRFITLEAAPAVATTVTLS